MNRFAVGFMGESDQLPGFGRRVGDVLQAHMRARLMGVGEVALIVKADKRDIRRLLTEGTCGPRLWDSLAAAFGWDFVEAVMSPAIGADPITAREQELAQHEAQIAALHARLERERKARSAPRDLGGGGRGAVRLVASSSACGA